MPAEKVQKATPTIAPNHLKDATASFSVWD